MKLFNKIGYLAISALLAMTACEKEPGLPFYDNGTNPVLTAPVTTLAPAAGDSNKVVFSPTWTSPAYATAENTVKYIVQIDSAGRNFSKAITREVVGDLSYSYTGKELNSILLDNLGFQINKPGDVELRIVSSFNNNNQRLNSNVVKVKMTPYKVPPRVALPTTGKLFIVGDATDGGWNNPVPTPTQQLTQIDETTYGGIFYLYGGAQYLILPLNGNWDNKYAVSNNGITGLSGGGDFGFNLSQNFPAPGADGWYKMILDFQTGKFSVTPFTQQHGLPQALVVVGGASPVGWNNAVDNPQKFTRLNSTRWEITVNLKSGEEYLILPEPGDWGKKFGVDNNSVEAAKLGGTLKPEGQNLKAPNETGNYKITVDYINNSYKLVKQ